MPRPKFLISKDNPAYYLTSVAKDRLPVFRTTEIASIVCKAIDEARTSGGFAIFAYVIMLEHLHLVTDSAKSTKETHRFINGIISRRVLDHLQGVWAHNLTGKAAHSGACRRLDVFTLAGSPGQSITVE